MNGSALIQELNVIVTTAGEATGGGGGSPATADWPGGWRWNGQNQGTGTGTGGYQPTAPRPSSGSGSDSAHWVGSEGGIVIDGAATITQTAPATVTRTARGKNNAKGVHDTLTIANVTVDDGEWLIISLAANSLAGDPTIDWGGTAIIQVVNQPATLSNVFIYARRFAVGGTHDVVITHTIAADRATAACVQTFLGSAAGGHTSSQATAGSSDNPDSGDLITAADTAFVAGCIGTEGPSTDGAGVWTQLTAGQREGTTGGADTSNVTVAEGYFLEPGVDIMAAEKTGITSRAWGAIIVRYDLT